MSLQKKPLTKHHKLFIDVFVDTCLLDKWWGNRQSEHIKGGFQQTYSLRTPAIVDSILNCSPN